MFCPNCGKQLESAASFCGACGCQITSQAEQSPLPVASPLPDAPPSSPVASPIPVAPPSSVAPPVIGQGTPSAYGVTPPKKSKTPIAVAGAIGAIAVIVILIVVITGFSGPRGTYYPRSGMAFFGSERITDIEFKSFGKAEIGTERNVYVDSSYKIKGSEITLKAEWNYNDKREVTYSYRVSGDSIFLDGVEYRKTSK